MAPTAHRHPRTSARDMTRNNVSWKVGTLVIGLALTAAVLLWPASCEGTSESISCSGVLVQESRDVDPTDPATRAAGPSDLQRSMMLRAAAAAVLVGGVGAGAVLVARRTSSS